MTYYTEIDWATHPGGRITKIQPHSLASELEIFADDILLAINDNKVMDVIDVQYYAAEEELQLLIRRNEELRLIEAHRSYNQSLGLEFEHPTFDTDIRRCNNLCEFCFVLQMAPRYRRTLYIKDDDYRYSFLLGHFVTLTNLDEHDWWRIETMGLSPLYVSVHVTDLAMRRRFLRNPTAPDIVEQLQRLSEYGTKVHTQLVIVPEFNDGKWLARSIEDLTQLWPAVQSISIVPVGLTKHHKYGMRPHTSQEASSMIDYIEDLQRELQKQFQRNFVYPSDEWYLVAGRTVPNNEVYDDLPLQENGLGMVREFLDDWKSMKVEITEWLLNSPMKNQPLFPDIKSVTLVTGQLFSEILETVANEFEDLTGIKMSVIPIENERLGRSISVAGLLMGEDVLAQLASVECGDLVIIPNRMFGVFELVTLDDVGPQQMADRIQRPLALADLMGDVWDAITGKSSVIFMHQSES